MTNILSTSLEDLRGDNQFLNGINRETCAELAYVWFFEEPLDSRDLGSFGVACTILDLDPGWLRSQLRREIAPQRLKDLHRRVHRPTWCEWYNQRDTKPERNGASLTYPWDYERWAIAQRKGLERELRRVRMEKIDV